MIENHIQPSRKRKLYNIIARFQREEDYKNWITANADFWALRMQNDGIKFESQYFQCRYSRRAGNFCTASIKVRKIDGEFIVEQSGEHDHQILTTKLSSQQKEFIREKITQIYRLFFQIFNFLNKHSYRHLQFVQKLELKFSKRHFNWRRKNVSIARLKMAFSFLLLQQARLN